MMIQNLWNTIKSKIFFLNPSEPSSSTSEIPLHDNLDEPLEQERTPSLINIHILDADGSRMVEKVSLPATIGTGADIVVNGRYVTASHGTIIQEENRFFYQDSSRNGTCNINTGQPVSLSARVEIFDTLPLRLGCPLDNTTTRNNPQRFPLLTISLVKEKKDEENQKLKSLLSRTTPILPINSRRQIADIQPEPDSTQEGTVPDEEVIGIEVVEEEAIAVAEESVYEDELTLKPEAEPEPETELEGEVELEEELTLVFDEDEEISEEFIDDEIGEEDESTAPEVSITLEVYVKRLLHLKELKQVSLTAAMESNETKIREKLQAVLVSLTRALTFPEQSLAHEISCREQALEALKEMYDAEVIDKDDYGLAREILYSDSTEEAEHLLDRVIKQNIPLSALASYHSACLAQCRMDFGRAMPRFDKAIELDKTNTDYIRSCGLLARQLYYHKKSLNCFVALEKLLRTNGDDSMELALARRELAYSAALSGLLKQAALYYKKAMGSLTRLAGSESPEMGICWYQIGVLQETLGNDEKARVPYKTAMDIMEKAGDESALIDILDKLARLQVELEEEAEAIVLFERLAGIMEKAPQPDFASLVIVYNNLAESYRVCGKYEVSENYYKKALTLTQDLRGPEHPAVGSIYQELAKLADRQKKPEEAEEYSEKATAIFDLVLEAQEAEGDGDAMLTL